MSNTGGTITIAADGASLRLNYPLSCYSEMSLFSGTHYWQASGGLRNIPTVTTHPITFGTGTGNAERGRVAADGTLYWGATTGSPGYGGGAGFAVFATGSLGQGVSGAAANVLMQRDTDGAALSFGRGALGSTPAAVGSITLSATAAAFNTSSDYRLKLNIADLLGSGAFIDALRPREWSWTVNGERGAGFVAHEVQAVSPGSVTGEKDATNEGGDPIYQGMQAGSSEIIAHMVAELQDQRRRVAALESAA